MVRLLVAAVLGFAVTGCGAGRTGPGPVDCTGGYVHDGGCVLTTAGNAALVAAVGSCDTMITGGAPGERAVARRVACAMLGTGMVRIGIVSSPAHEPAGSLGLSFVVAVPPQPGSATSPRAAVADAGNERAAWAAAVAAGAIRDANRIRHLPHVVAYNLFLQSPGTRPRLQSQGRIALPGWGDPEGQGTMPPTTIGHGAPSRENLLRTLGRIGQATETHAVLAWHKPLGAAPAVTVTTAHPKLLLGHGITRYLNALRFLDARYDGALLLVVDRAQRPVWIATTASRAGIRGCSVLSKEAGVDHGPFPSFNSPGDKACAASGTEFS